MEGVTLHSKTECFRAESVIPPLIQLQQGPGSIFLSKLFSEKKKSQNSPFGNTPPKTNFIPL